MTELEKMQRAKDYMDKLANGIDPIGGESLDSDAVLNNVRLSRCFFYVSDVLRQVIENGGIGKRAHVSRASLPPFSLPYELRGQIEITEKPTIITQFANRINALVDTTTMKKLSPTVFTSWLVSKGFLFEETVGGKRRKKPSQAGADIGIEFEAREGQFGGYIAILYTESAQRFLIDNLDVILAAQLANPEDTED